MRVVIAVSLLVSGLRAVSIGTRSAGLSINEAQQQELPIITLPYGRYQAHSYDRSNDLYAFRNVRFGAPPVGNLRWAKPAPPANNDTLQTGNYGPACLQEVPFSMLAGDGNGFVRRLIESLASYLDLGRLAAQSSAISEDCLFLDVLVPAKALKSGAEKLPIVNWIYGGAYVLGSKDGLYDGTPVVKASGGNVIYVAGNYRVGAFGWLGGSTMEKDGTPNAALWDQRAVLEWIEKYGGLFGGDVDNVSVWGESAGAGSIVHHLTAFGGARKALFKRAVIQSPAFDPMLDRNGTNEQQLVDFAKLAGCTGEIVSCLRATDAKVLQKAQRDYGKRIPGGKPGFGPVVDGDFVPQLPAVQMAQGKYAQGIESIISSHTHDEAAMFAPSNPTPNVFDDVLRMSYISAPAALNAIKQHYASLPDDQARVKALFGHSTFTCNNRYIAESFPGKTYSVEYGRGAGVHGTDIFADFYDPSATMTAGYLLSWTDWGYKDFATKYQSYLTSHARTGDPNTFKKSGLPQWPTVKAEGEVLDNVMNATDSGFALGKDMATKAEDCEFWKKTWIQISKTVEQ